jgi:hypothetical protein
MRSPGPGTDTSPVEVTNISPHGIWLLANDEELYLPFDAFPWFRHARVSDILAVEVPLPGHLHWPALDVDLSLDCIRHPEKYPLVAQSAPGTPTCHEP